MLTIHEAIQQGLINTTSSESTEHGQNSHRNPQLRIPVGDFGIDKHVKSIRTKFNKDGTSVLQIDIESTKPTKGIFEIDEIEEFTLNQKLPGHHQSSIEIDTDSIRQVVDINSVQTVRQAVSPSQRLELLEYNFKKDREQRVYETERELGSELSIQRIEDVLDDCCDSSESLIRKQTVERKHQQQQQQQQSMLAERPNCVKASEHQRVLVIDDINEPKKAVNINGVSSNTRKEEIHIDEAASSNSSTYSNEERLRRIVETSTTELNHQHLHRLNQLSHQTTAAAAAMHVGEVHVRPVHAHVVDLGFERREVPQRVEACDIPYETTTTTTRKEVTIAALALLIKI